MSVKFVKMIKDGVTMSDVHPDAVAAHEAVGWVIVPEPVTKKPVEPEDKTADNDTVTKTRRGKK